MLNLLAKDFKLLFGKDTSLSKRVLSIILTIVFAAMFIGIEVFLYTRILTNEQIKSTPNAIMALTSLFLFVISIIIIVSDLVSANKLFFNEKDIEQLSIHPVDEISIIFSKLIFLFFTLHKHQIRDCKTQTYRKQQQTKRKTSCYYAVDSLHILLTFCQPVNKIDILWILTKNSTI